MSLTLGSISSLLFGIVTVNVSPESLYSKPNLFNSTSISLVLIVIPSNLFTFSLLNVTTFEVLSTLSIITSPSHIVASAYFSSKWQALFTASYVYS